MKHIRQNLVDEVSFLSCDIGERSCRDVDKLNTAAAHIDEKLRSCGCELKKQAFVYKGNTYYNIIGEIRGTDANKSGVLVIGRELFRVSCV